jgi:hypothetical protein
LDEVKWRDWLDFLYDRLPAEYVAFNVFLASLPSQGGWGARKGRVRLGLRDLIRHGRAERRYRYGSFHGQSTFTVLYRRAS